MSMFSVLKWALTNQMDYVEHHNPLMRQAWKIDTKTGEYVNKINGLREPADVRSKKAVNNSYWTSKKI